MFRDFSFDPLQSPSYSAYEAERAAMNVSPTSMAPEPNHHHHHYYHHHHHLNRPPTPPCTMGDLAVQLHQQSLRIDTNIRCYPPGPLTPGSEEEEGVSPTIDQIPQERPTYSRVAASVLRMQRQANSRMQCSSSHVRDISKLVKMIEQEQQCTVSEPSSRTSSTSTASTSPPAPCTASAGMDEGVDMAFDMSSQGFETLVGTPTWRSGDRHESCIRVTKPVRMRKRSKVNNIGKRRSS